MIIITMGHESNGGHGRGISRRGERERKGY
jgi:hypothetical protein